MIYLIFGFFHQLTNSLKQVLDILIYRKFAQKSVKSIKLIFCKKTFMSSCWFNDFFGIFASHTSLLLFSLISFDFRVFQSFQHPTGKSDKYKSLSHNRLGNL